MDRSTLPPRYCFWRKGGAPRDCPGAAPTPSESPWSEELLAPAAIVGFAIVDASSDRTGALVQAFAAGALLKMIADTLAPEAYKKSGGLTGLATALGFVLAVALTSLD